MAQRVSDCGVLDNDALASLIALAPQARVSARVAEGFAFYALFPENCLQANVEDAGERIVIGVRSIGMALAPLLAEALDAHLCLTLRPAGHPFARVCRLSPRLRDLLRAHRDARFCVVDEGPGLSGSSFGSVADALEDIGVARASIDFFPSHPGEPGAAASPAHRERWSAARKHVLDSTPAITHALGAYSVLRDMSGGLWRAGHAQRGALEPSLRAAQVPGRRCERPMAHDVFRVGRDRRTQDAHGPGPERSRFHAADGQLPARLSRATLDSRRRAHRPGAARGDHRTHRALHRVSGTLSSRPAHWRRERRGPPRHGGLQHH